MDGSVVFGRNLQGAIMEHRRGCPITAVRGAAV